MEYDPDATAPRDQDGRQVIVRPCASDPLGATFRAAYRTAPELPVDLRALLARLGG